MRIVGWIFLIGLMPGIFVLIFVKISDIVEQRKYEREEFLRQL
jgi:hypothetical protein